MDDDTVRVAVDLRLGTALCRPHNCHHGSLEVDCLATNALSCCWSEGRYYCHATLNDIVHKVLAVAKIPSRLEPSGLYREDGKRTDDITLVPSKSGRLLVWDVTCPDTFAPFYSSIATRGQELWQLLQRRGRRPNMSA